jgi:hypothetical protein
MKTASVRESAGGRGSALVAVIVLLTGMLVMSYAFFRTTVSAQKSAHADLEDKRAFFLAESGLHEAYQAIRTGHPGGVATADQPALLGGGVLWVEATPLGGDQTRLVSTGMAGQGREALEAVIHYQPEKPPLFVATLNSKENLTLNEGVTIDSFDSDLGTYASQMVNFDHGHPYAGANGDVRSNADVILNAHSTTFGDAIPGPEHAVTFSTGAYVSGAIEPAKEPFVFPPIEFPSFPPLGNYSVAASASKTLASGNYNFGSFTLNKSSSLTVTGPATIVVDSFTGGKTAALKIDATLGPVTIFVRGAYSHISGFACTPVGTSPMSLAFMVNGTSDVVFPAGTKVRGAYYAPNANILFANMNECWGAFAAKRISMSNDMKFHFDEALLDDWDGEGGDEGDRLSVLSWRPITVESSLLRTDRRDPLQVLGLDAANLPAPGLAWQE